MSHEATNGVYARSTAQTPAELLVLLAMADWAGQAGDCYASYAAIARKSRLSERQVIRIIAKFVLRGELTKDRFGHKVEARGHRRGKTGLQARNWYWFTTQILSADEGVTGRGDTDAPRGDIHDTEGVTSTPERGDIHATHIRNEPLVDPLSDPLEARVASPRLAYKGRRLDVPRFLHEQFANQLGPTGTAIFDLHTWYRRLDDTDDGPIVGDVLTFIRKAFAEESKRVFGSRSVGSPVRLPYADWTCPHTPRCLHPTRCDHLQAIAAEKAQASA